jgi:hypothetical protein
MHVVCPAYPILPDSIIVLVSWWRVHTMVLFIMQSFSILLLVSLSWVHLVSSAPCFLAHLWILWQRLCFSFGIWQSEYMCRLICSRMMWLFPWSQITNAWKLGMRFLKLWVSIFRSLCCRGYGSTSQSYVCWNIPCRSRWSRFVFLRIVVFVYLAG